MSQSASDESDAVFARLRATGPGEPSGRETFARYRYQIKRAVLFWLETLVAGGPRMVLLEYQEDVVVVYADRVRWCQVKTRKPTRSAWSFAVISKAGGGLDSLVRTYAATADIPGTYELLLEGRAASNSPTPEFFATPQLATATCKQAVLELGIDKSALPDLLGRLVIRADQVSRNQIDNVCILTLMRLMPSLTFAAAQELYANLLTIAENAQEAWSEDPARVAALLSQPDARGNEGCLTAERLRDLLPAQVYTVEEWRDLTSRDGISDLERKLRMAGASDSTIDKAIALRAQADLRLREAAAASESESEYARRLSAEALDMAKALAAPHKYQAMAGDHVFSSLISSSHVLQALDSDRLFRSPFELVGVVCQESDECRFGWRVP